MVSRAYKAGGQNTTKNGKKFEESSILKSHFQIVGDPINTGKGVNSYALKYIIGDDTFYWVTQKGLYDIFKYFKVEVDTTIKKNHIPDQALVNFDKKIVFIFEAKYQTRSGSVDTKLGASNYFTFFYETKLPGFKIKYAFLVNDYFNKEEYDFLRTYLNKINTPMFCYGNDCYRKDIEEWINNSMKEFVQYN